MCNKFHEASWLLYKESPLSLYVIKYMNIKNDDQ